MIKRGQLEISFGMIFAIMLIVIFIGFAVWVVIKIIVPAECINTGLLKEELQNNIDRAFNSDETKFPLKLDLNSGVKKVCIIDFSKQQKGEFKEEYSSFERDQYKSFNLFFYPLESACADQSGFTLKHIDLDKITEEKNPYCITNNKGVTIQIEGYYGKLVVLS